METEIVVEPEVQVESAVPELAEASLAVGAPAVGAVQTTGTVAVADQADLSELQAPSAVGGGLTPGFAETLQECLTAEPGQFGFGPIQFTLPRWISPATRRYEQALNDLTLLVSDEIAAGPQSQQISAVAKMLSAAVRDRHISSIKFDALVEGIKDGLGDFTLADHDPTRADRVATEIGQLFLSDLLADPDWQTAPMTAIDYVDRITEAFSLTEEAVFAVVQYNIDRIARPVTRVGFDIELAAPARDALEAMAGLLVNHAQGQESTVRATRDLALGEIGRLLVDFAPNGAGSALGVGAVVERAEELIQSYDLRGAEYGERFDAALTQIFGQRLGANQNWSLEVQDRFPGLYQNIIELDLRLQGNTAPLERFVAQRLSFDEVGSAQRQEEIFELLRSCDGAQAGQFVAALIAPREDNSARQQGVHSAAVYVAEFQKEAQVSRVPNIALLDQAITRLTLATALHEEFSSGSIDQDTVRTVADVQADIRDCAEAAILSLIVQPPNNDINQAIQRIERLQVELRLSTDETREMVLTSASDVLRRTPDTVYQAAALLRHFGMDEGDHLLSESAEQLRSAISAQAPRRISELLQGAPDEFVIDGGTEVAVARAHLATAFGVQGSLFGESTACEQAVLSTVTERVEATTPGAADDYGLLLGRALLDRYDRTLAGQEWNEDQLNLFRRYHYKVDLQVQKEIRHSIDADISRGALEDVRGLIDRFDLMVERYGVPAETIARQAVPMVAQELKGMKGREGEIDARLVAARQVIDWVSSRTEEGPGYYELRRLRRNVNRLGMRRINNLLVYGEAGEDGTSYIADFAEGIGFSPDMVINQAHHNAGRFTRIRNWFRNLGRRGPRPVNQLGRGADLYSHYGSRSFGDTRLESALNRLAKRVPVDVFAA